MEQVSCARFFTFSVSSGPDKASIKQAVWGMFPSTSTQSPGIIFMLTTGNPCTMQGPGAPTPTCSLKFRIAFDSIVTFCICGFNHLQMENSTFDPQLRICIWKYKNTVFFLWLVESSDVKPMNMKGQLYWKRSTYMLIIYSIYYKCLQYIVSSLA